MYSHIAVGGTFDHFHTGHEHLLKTAFKSAKKVTIGITNDNLLDHKEFKESIEPFEVRKKNLLDFLIKNKLNTNATIVQIHDIFGPASTDRSIDSIIATKETLRNVNLLNNKRVQNGLNKLKIVPVNFIKSEDKKIIRSARIRKGEINNQGINYKYLFKKNPILTLPSALKKTLRNPFGEVITISDENLEQTAKKAISFLGSRTFPIIITVGDVVSESLAKQGYIPDIQIIDKKTQRKDYLPTKSLQIDSFSKNSPGKIQKAAVMQLSKNINTFLTKGKKQIQLIKGEEDLMALPAMLLAPLDSLIVYGQSSLGIILVVVTSQTKKKVEFLLSKFS